MRTGSLGSRNAEDMVKTLVEPKRLYISSVRQKLLARSLEEEVEYDSINIEPVLIYGFENSDRRVFVKHKWECVILVRLNSREEVRTLMSEDQTYSTTEENDQDGTLWAKFNLPEGEALALRLVDELMKNPTH